MDMNDDARGTMLPEEGTPWTSTGRFVSIAASSWASARRSAGLRPRIDGNSRIASRRGMAVEYTAGLGRAWTLASTTPPVLDALASEPDAGVAVAILTASSASTLQRETCLEETRSNAAVRKRCSITTAARAPASVRREPCPARVAWVSLRSISLPRS